MARMAGNGWTWLDMAGMAGNGWKGLEIAGDGLNGWKWLVVKCRIKWDDLITVLTVSCLSQSTSQIGLKTKNAS